MTPEERAREVCTYRNLMAIEGLRAAVADAIRQAIAEEKEACAQVADQYSGSAAKAIRERQ